MIRLNLPKEPYWMDLVHGVRLKVKPLTTAVYEAARIESQRRVRRIQEEMIEARSAGGRVEGLPDLDDEAALLGFSQFLFVQCLARAAIEDWEGVGDERGNPVEASPAYIDELMNMHTMAEEFLVQYTRPYAEVIREGEFSTAGENGTSAEEPGTAGNARN